MSKGALSASNVGTKNARGDIWIRKLSKTSALLAKSSVVGMRNTDFGMRHLFGAVI